MSISPLIGFQFFEPSKIVDNQNQDPNRETSYQACWK